MYNWGYLKNVILAKLDLDEEEAGELNYIDRFQYYANEAMTQICSAVLPKRTFYTFEVHNGKYDNNGNLIEESNLNTPITLPNDFVSFGDDKNTIEEDIGYGDIMIRELHDEDFDYKGYKTIVCRSLGKYSISYNARWLSFENLQSNSLLDAPTDVLECIPSYVASQCMKVDDEYKSSVFRNEFELLLARIDNTDYKSNKTFSIGGDW